MKKISILLIVISLVIAGFTFMKSISPERKIRASSAKDNKISHLIKLLDEYPAKSKPAREGLEEIKNEIRKLKPTNEMESCNNQNPKLLWVKLIFSFLFGGAALYVVLSQKYNEQTQKWAFNIITIISGVWIGTIG